MEPSLEVHIIRPGWDPPFKFKIYAPAEALSFSSHIVNMKEGLYARRI
jgi:hypothetical protein